MFQSGGGDKITMEKYNLEKAQEEAAKLYEKVESEKAWGYDDAEEQITRCLILV